MNVFKSWPEAEVFSNFVKNFQPFHVIQAKLSNHIPTPENLLTLSCEVDICSTEDESKNIFYGDVSRQEHLKMKLSSFVEGWIAAEKNEHHWIQNVGLRLYLSQSTVYSSNLTFTPVQITGLQCEVGIPLPLINSNTAVSQINLWMNIDTVQSGLHYDAYNNILVVQRGRKVVNLISPQYTNSTRAVYLVSGGGANHSLVSTVAELIAAGSLLSSETVTFTLLPGDALFIPEGWWHEVSSDKCSMAFNFWFPSIIQELIHGDGNSSSDKAREDSVAGSSSKMASYLLRASFQTLVEADMKNNYESDSQVSHAFCKTGVGDQDQMTDVQFETFMIEMHERYHRRSINTSESISMIPLKNEENNQTKDNQHLYDMEDYLVASSYETMSNLWPGYAKKFPLFWGHILSSLRPIAAYRLTTSWENIGTAHPVLSEELGEFFESIFNPLGGRAIVIRRHLISQSDELAKESCARILKDVLGL